MKTTEAVISRMPFIVRRRVKWGDCDPAGVVYTPVFGEYVISTAELFYEELLGMSPQHAKQFHGFGTPTRALAFDFRGSLRPDDEFDIEVQVSEVRSRSYVLTLTARTQVGDIVFVATHTPVCVARDERKGIVIPDVFREALLSYQSSYARVHKAPAGEVSS
ncbi:acyl-CoA thioesterase [Pseudomonas gingeri]|uniref:acyl-CoA thioesterase n=1 Tax=Pseudomonas gingeri TaxID=117681 RepID=UPI0015A07B12|nr:acyl-CoA thioesterase [Pseudomonas gingeri]NVZ24672.1 acyl-CoA thioesterase [Pseudomonas gingeri]